MDPAEEQQGPARVRRAAPLSPAQRRRVLALAALPVLLAAVVLAPLAGPLGASAGDVVAAALVYGGLLGLAVGFVAVDRFQARQCPRCRTRDARTGGASTCPACGYDLTARPRYTCEERHGDFLEPGLCDCGRRLQPRPVARGVGPQVAFTLKVGAWLLAFLVGVALLLRVLEGRL